MWLLLWYFIESFRFCRSVKLILFGEQWNYIGDDRRLWQHSSINTLNYSHRFNTRRWCLSISAVMSILFTTTSKNICKTSHSFIKLARFQSSYTQGTKAHSYQFILIWRDCDESRLWKSDHIKRPNIQDLVQRINVKADFVHPHRFDEYLKNAVGL